MKRNTSQIFVTVIKPLPAILILSFSIVVFWVIAVRSPNILRSLSMLLRTGYTLVVPAIYLALYLAFWLKGWFGNFFSITIILSIFALALSGVWISGQTESGLLSGVLPMFDSETYHGDALRLLAGIEFSAASTSRPIFTAFFAFLLWVTKHDLLHALALLTLLVALACYLLANEIRRTYSPAIAAFVLVFLFIYYRYHSGVIRTENLGILFGALGTALIWRGITFRRQIYLLAGISLTSIGMIARAGAFFVLPLLVLWGAFYFRQKGKLVSWRFIAGGLTSVALAFIANLLVTKSFGTSDVIPFGNFSYSFYGLASGGNSWADVLKLYPGASQLEIYRLAIQLILEQPDLLLKGVVHNYSMFFSNTNYGLFSYMSGEGKTIASISYWILLLLSLKGVWNWYQYREDPYLGFVMVSTIGLLLSVPFLPPTDAFRLRAYATSIVILALLPALGLHGILTKLRMDRFNPEAAGYGFENILAAFSGFVVVIVLLGPFAAKGTDVIPPLDRTHCEAGLTSVVVRYNPGSMVHLVSQNTLLLDRAPNYHIGTFRRSVHGFPNIYFIDWAVDSVAPNHSLFAALDYRTFRPVLAVVRSPVLPAPPALLELCGTWEEKPDIARFNIFYASSVNLISQD